MRKNRKNKNRKEPGYKSFICCVIMVFLVICPFVVFFHMERLQGASLEYFSHNKGITVDFFLYFKEQLLLGFCIFLILFFIGEKIFPDHVVKNFPLRSKKARILLVLCAVYASAAILSGILSPHKETVFWGICTEYEGLAALLSYVVLFLAGYNYFGTEKGNRILKAGLTVLMACIGIGAAVEFFYRPLFELEFMKYLIAPKEYRGIAESLKNARFQGQAALGLYNPGYLGGICALLLPVSLGMAMEETIWWKKPLRLLNTAGLLLALFASSSTGALYAVLFTLPVMALLFRSAAKKLFLMLGLSLGVFAAIALCTAMFGQNALLQKMVSVALHESSLNQNEERFRIKKISLDEGRLYIEGNGGELTIAYDPGKADALQGCSAYDGAGNRIPMITKGEKAYLKKAGYDPVSLQTADNMLILDLGYMDTMDFYLTPDGLKLAGQNGEPMDEIPQASSRGLEKWYSALTGRGYTWIHTLPVLKECLVYGKGPGGFVFSFPQWDVAGLMNTHGSYKLLVDKPHNWYLQVWVSTGLLSLLALLTLFIRYVIKAGRAYLGRSRGMADRIMEKSLFAGLAAFWITGMVNDSSITVNPVFWVLFGIACEKIDALS